MKLFTKIVPILAATVWISFSEFFRNNILLINYWKDHYHSLGLVFPSEPTNGAIWGLWSLCFAVVIFFIAKKYDQLQTTLIAWFAVFVLMWLVIGNLKVLPTQILIIAVPLSLLETYIATWIIKKLDKEK